MGNGQSAAQKHVSTSSTTTQTIPTENEEKVKSQQKVAKKVFVSVLQRGDTETDALVVAEHPDRQCQHNQRNVTKTADNTNSTTARVATTALTTNTVAATNSMESLYLIDDGESTPLDCRRRGDSTATTEPFGSSSKGTISRDSSESSKGSTIIDDGTPQFELPHVLPPPLAKPQNSLQQPVQEASFGLSNTLTSKPSQSVDEETCASNCQHVALKQRDDTKTSTNHQPRDLNASAPVVEPLESIPFLVSENASTVQSHQGDDHANTVGLHLLYSDDDMEVEATNNDSHHPLYSRNFPLCPSHTAHQKVTLPFALLEKPLSPTYRRTSRSPTTSSQHSIAMLNDSCGTGRTSLFGREVISEGDTLATSGRDSPL